MADSASKHLKPFIQFILFMTLTITCQGYIDNSLLYSNEHELSIISQSRNFSVFANETVQLPCLVKQQTPSTVVIWNQCEDPKCEQVRNPLTINKDNFIQDLRFRVLFENLQDKIQNGQVKNEEIPRHTRSRFRYRDAEPSDSSINGDINKWTLEIRKFSKKDEGCYQCQLNSFEPKTISYCIHLQKKIYATPKKQTVSVGSKIELKCSTDESVRLSSVKWYKNGHRIATNNHKKISTYSDKDFMHTSLLIEKSTYNDAGSYSCKFDHMHARIHVHVVSADKNARLINNASLIPKSTSERSNPDKNDSYFDSYKFFALSGANECRPFALMSLILSVLSVVFVHITSF